MEIRENISSREYFILGFFGFFLFVILWSLVTYGGMVKDFFLPTPTIVISSIAMLLTKFNIIYDIFVSFYRVVVGFLLAVVVAVPLGILVGSIKKIEAFLEPLVAFIRYIPPSAFVPLFILWFGVSDLQKFSIIFIGVAPYLLILVADAVSYVKNEFIEAGLTLGAKTKDVFMKIIIAGSLPGIWDGMQLMFGAAWTFVILSEIISATSGLGHVIIQSQRFLQTANVVSVIVMIGILGLITDCLFKLGYKKLFSWSEKKR